MKAKFFQNVFFIYSHFYMPFSIFLFSVIFEKVNHEESILIDDSIQMNKDIISVPKATSLKLMLNCQQQGNEY